MAAEARGEAHALGRRETDWVDILVKVDPAVIRAPEADKGNVVVEL
jgi:hypothetical protein